MGGGFALGAKLCNPDDDVWIMLNACPSACPEDLDASGDVDFQDLLALLDAWGDTGGPEDLDGSGLVDFGDLLLLVAAWGPCGP